MQSEIFKPLQTANKAYYTSLLNGVVALHCFWLSYTLWALKRVLKAYL